MARFKFGKKKKEVESPPANVDHSYFRPPSMVLLPTTTRTPQTPPSLDERASPEPSFDDNVPETYEPVADSGASPWKRHKLFDSPFPRYRHVALSVASEKNEIYLMGGLKEGSVFGDTWKIVPQLSPSGRDIDGFVAQHVEVVNSNNPPARVGHASVFCGNAYIIYGGDTVDTDYNGFPDDNFYMFNINNHKYTIPLHILNKPRGRYGHLIAVVSTSAVSSRLYLFGGQLENDVYNDLFYFELTNFKLPKARWELVEPLNTLKPPPLTNHSMAVHKNKIYVFGGVYNNEKVSNDLWCFDTVISKWQQLPTTGQVPLPVNEHSAVIVGDRLYVYGGNDFSGAIYDTFYSLDLHTLKWTMLKDKTGGPGPRCGHSMSYIAKLNKFIIMGGDKNDYIYSEPGNLETYENFDGQELGTMIYELDVAAADRSMRGEQPKKFAASAGGASGVLNKRNASPLPSEDAMTRHRRSMSAGQDDFRTPNGSVERLRSLDPKSETPASLDLHTQEDLDVPDKFVDVDIPSSSAVSQMDDTSELEELRNKYVDDELNGKENFRAENNDTPVLSNDYAHLSQFNSQEHDAPLFGSNSPRKAQGSTRSALLAGAAATGAAAAGTAAVELNSRDTTTSTPSRSLSQRLNGTGRISSPSHNSESDGKVKKIIAELNAELNELKASTKEQMENATAKIRSLDDENRQLKQQHETALQERQAHLERSLEEKDAMIDELKRSVDPADLQINDNDTGSIATSGRGFTELTKYKLNRLELSNRLVYLEDENAQLKEKQARFEPFMNNQIGELSSLQKIIRGQEEKIAGLTTQVKSEVVLHKEIADWKRKFEDLELEFNSYRALNSEVEISDDEDGISRGVDPDSSVATGATRSTKTAVSSQLENLILLWLATSTAASDLRLLNEQDTDMVSQLQKQVDDLLKTSREQHEGSSAEVRALETDLQAKLVSLRTFEDNYRDALQSVKNTSKALNLTQDELQSQKLLIEKLVKENNELKIFKRASSASKRASTPPTFASTEQVAETADEDEGFTSAHYNMKLRDLEADLYILKQERDQLNDTVSSLKKELYLAQNSN